MAGRNFDKKLREFGNVQEKLSDMIARHYATESIVYMLSSNMDRGVQDYQLEAAIGKIAASENAWNVCDEAIQLHGGMGFMREALLERILRDLRIFRIFEGANDVMRLFIALTGMQHLGKQLKKLQNDVKSVNITAILSEVSRRINRSKSGQIRELVHPELKDSAKLLEDVIKSFGTTAEKLLKTHRQGIIDRQHELIKMANAIIDIYSMTATLSRCNYVIQNNGIDSATHDIQITKYFVHKSSKRASKNIEVAANPSITELKLINEISKSVCDNQAMIQKHPISV